MRTQSKMLAALGCAILVLGASGCKRSDDARDTRTLEQRPHVETVRPEDRKDMFRP